nr:hypothetical protein [Tanacetum cinerariifolium]
MFDYDDYFTSESDDSLPPSPIYDSSVFDCDEMFSSESDVSIPASPIYDRYQSGEWYHDVPPPYTGTFMPPKPDPVFHDAPIVNETVPTAFNVELSPTKPEKDLSQSNRPTVPINEDWVSDSDDESEGKPMTAQKAPSFVQTTEHVKTHRSSIKTVEHPIPAANLKTYIPKPKGHGNSRNRKASFVLLTRSKLVPLITVRPVTTAVPHNNVIRPRPAKIVGTRPHSPPRKNISHRPSPSASNFPLKVTTVKASKVNAVKGVRRNWVLKPKFPILDHVSRHTSASMTPKKFDYTDALGRSKEDAYLTDFKERNGEYVAFGGNPKGGKITDPLGKFDGKADEGFLVGYPVSKSGPTWMFDIDTLTKSMNYQPVTAGNQSNLSAGIHEQFDAEKAGEENVQQYMLFPLWSSGCKDPHNTNNDATFEVKEPEFEVEKPESEVHVSPSSKFEDFFDNSINEVNAASTSVPAVRQLSTNSTNTFSADGPSNTADSPTHEKSSYVDPSQYPDDPNMPALEDVTYSDDEEDINNEEFHTCMFACFLSQEEPKRLHQALKDPSWIEAMQEELLRFKMQKEEGIDYEEVFSLVARI